jgi:hypothetical protein
VDAAVRNLAVMLADGGDCLSDRQPGQEDPHDEEAATKRPRWELPEQRRRPRSTSCQMPRRHDMTRCISAAAIKSDMEPGSFLEFTQRLTWQVANP